MKAPVRAVAGTFLAVPAASSAAAVTATCAKTSDWGTGFEGKCTITSGTGAGITE